MKTNKEPIRRLPQTTINELKEIIATDEIFRKFLLERGYEFSGLDLNNHDVMADIGIEYFINYKYGEI